MIEAASGFGLLFVLGLRHGLDPDHVAVIDDLVFRTVDARPRWSAWTGAMFAAGHSFAVGAVALGVSLVAGRLALPVWWSALVDAAVIAMLLAVGTLNLAALLRRRVFAPVGWRARLVPARWRASTHPAAVVAIGVVFGLVFDTATQAAAWGAAASAHGGPGAAVGIAGAFAAGMVIADTLDSQIVSRLLRAAPGGGDTVARYRRGVGWVIVALSYATAAVALCGAGGIEVGIGDGAFTALGIASASLVAMLLFAARHAARRRLRAG